jgi:HEPN domain-containing protein
MSDNIKYWIETALYDIEVADSLYDKIHYLYSAFLCHQSVEKMLKALYVKKHNSFPPKIHNLLKLAELSDIRSKMSENHFLFLTELDPMNIEARYPSYKENIHNLLSKKDAKNILLKSKELLKWLQSHLN